MKLWEYLHEQREHLLCYEKFDEKEALKRLILSDLHSFVKHIKNNYVNRDIINIKHNKEEMLVSISFTGDLYDKKSGYYFDKVESHDLWNQIYRFAKSGTLEVLEEG